MAGVTTAVSPWIAYGIAPAAAFAGVIVSQVLTLITSGRQDRRSNREEVMRTLRWAAEFAVSDDSAKARLGVDQLGALDESELLDDGQRRFVLAALNSVVSDPVEEVEEIEEAGGTAEVRAEFERLKTQADPILAELRTNLRIIRDRLDLPLTEDEEGGHA